VPTIKHVGNHTDQLHDGRPLPTGAVRTIDDDDLALDHYQDRLAAQTLILVPDEKPTARTRKPTSQEDAS
jgi:hypothetical protein